MDKTTKALTDQLEKELAVIDDRQIGNLVKEAEDEALATIRTILKEITVHVMLERVLGYLQRTGNSTVPVGRVLSPDQKGCSILQPPTEGKSADEPPLPAAQSQTDMENKEQAQKEIEAIRRKIAENKELLGQTKASPNDPGLAPARLKPGLEPTIKDASSLSTEDSQNDFGHKITDGYLYYVYGIVGGDGDRLPRALPENGVDPTHPVYALPYGPVQAIISKVSPREFDQEPLKANLEDMQWLEARVRAHEGVLETVMATHPVIPMKFCTIYRSESRVQEVLAQHQNEFAEALTQLEGRKEWGVEIYADREILAKRIGEASERLKKLEAEIGQKSAGMAYFGKKKLAEVSDEEMERFCDECAQHSHDRLSKHVEKEALRALRSKETTDRKEEMILNAAYLVADEQLAAFRAELEGLGAEYGGYGLVYKMTGPWPPYNFVRIGTEAGVVNE